MRKPKPHQRRTKRLLVSLTPDEHAALTAAASAARLPLAVYLRVLGLGHEPKSFLDQDAVRAVIRAHGDFGRIGGLLKLWLSEPPTGAVSAEEVRDLLNQVEAAALDVRQKVLAL